ncbi:MAG TPA: M23 family metallopeptidase [Spirochaetota bacterium]|nr:M23 family metallopeptidase [Spirochaetota bacterium]HOM39136.1 M23 family metallopeptidase [Spirochaetota bacterium]
MVKLKYKYKIILIILFLLSITLFSADWPVKDITYKNFTSFFGETRGDHFHNGVDIVKKGAKIYPIEKGEILFYYDEDEEPTRATIGIGKYVIIDHYEYRSYYCHLDKIDIKNKILIDKNQSIGIIGNTGRSSGEHLHFAIKKNNFFIDPFEILKLNIEKTNNSPIIDNILFKSGYYMSSENDKETSLTLPFREVFDIYILARTYDDREMHKGIKEVTIDIKDNNDKNVLSNLIKFNYIENNKLNGKHSIDEIYTKVWERNYIYLGRWTKKYRRENYTLIITVKDIWGNSKVLKKSISFK